jgi:GNAT superfamily N-acetyltransferase
MLLIRPYQPEDQEAVFRLWEECGLINYLAVDPKHQRKGCASQIMAVAETALRNAGCLKINVQIRTTNRKVMAFYDRLGFTVDLVISMGKRLERDEPEAS